MSMVSEYSEHFSAQFRRVQDTFQIVDETDFSSKSPPSDANSEFTINDLMGSWAEELVFSALRNVLNNTAPIMYGRADQLIAGQDGFKQLWGEHMQELDTIGKRPDILLFEAKFASDYLSGTDNIAEHPEKWKFVNRAFAGIEVRSSKQNLTINEEYKSDAISNLVEELQSILPALIQELRNLDLGLKSLNAVLDWLDILNIAEDIPYTIPRKPGIRVKTLGENLHHQLNQAFEMLRGINKHYASYRSFTVKVEDLAITEKWVATYSVPHYYVQVFDDRVYGIPTTSILDTILDEDGKSTTWKIERNPKNQMKTTFYVNLNRGYFLGNITTLPDLRPKKIQLKNGRVIYAIGFTGGELTLDEAGLQNCFANNLEV